MNVGLGFTAFKLQTENAGGDVLLLPFGTHETVDGGVSFEFTPADAGRVVDFFKARGIDFLFDYEHQSIAHLPGFEQFKSPDGRAPAAGWAGKLEARADGLYAGAMRWTPEAAAAVKSGAYRYFSPVLIWDKNGRVKAVYSAGLTNEPRLKNIPALAARCDLGELLLSLSKEQQMLSKEVAGALGVKTDATDPEIIAAFKTLQDKAAAGDTAAGQITAFKSDVELKGAKVVELEGKIVLLTGDVTKRDGEITALKSAMTSKEQSLVETVLLFATETGRITPAAKDQWKALAEKDPVATLTALKSQAAGSAVPTGRITETGKKKEDETTTQGAGGGPDDHIAACKATVPFDAGRLKLHEDALAYQRAHAGTSYNDAVVAVQRK